MIVVYAPTLQRGALQVMVGHAPTKGGLNPYVKTGHAPMRRRDTPLRKDTPMRRPTVPTLASDATSAHYAQVAALVKISPQPLLW